MLSGLLFLLRGIWMIRAPERLNQRWVRVLPHVIDTLLFAAGVTLILVTRQYPGATAWLSAKLIAVLIYIGLGMVALRHGRIRTIRVSAFFAALIVYMYILGAAVTRSPFVF